MTRVLFLIMLAALLNGCAGVDSEQTVEPLGAQSIAPPIPAPSVNAVQRVGVDHACVTAPPKGTGQTSQQRLQTPEFGTTPVVVGPVVVLPAPAGGNSGSLPEPASVDDVPPSGGDGSFNLSLGQYGVSMGQGVLATHSHRERHLLWYVDLPKSPRGQPLRSKYQRRALILEPDSTIEIELEQRAEGNRNFSNGGKVLMQQTDVPGYAKAALSGHKLTCDQDYAWKVTGSEAVLLADLTNPRSTVKTFVAAKSPVVEAQRMKRLIIKSPNKPDRTVNFSSGCANFQVCGHWNRCQSMYPRCASTGWEDADGVPSK